MRLHRKRIWYKTAYVGALCVLTFLEVNVCMHLTNYAINKNHENFSSDNKRLVRRVQSRYLQIRKLKVLAVSV
jgi:hypothetical protein